MARSGDSTKQRSAFHVHPWKSTSHISVRRRAQILRHAREALDGAANAKRWLQQPNRSLGGKSPSAVLADGDLEAAERVDELLYGLEYGMLA